MIYLPPRWKSRAAGATLPRMRRWLRHVAVPACFALLSACAEEPRTRDLPYEGEAFPESRKPHGVPTKSLAIVSNNQSDTLSLLDLAANRTVTSIPIDLDPIGTDGPHHLAIDPRAEFLYVPLAYPPPTAALGPHGQHGASALPGVVVKLRVSDLSRVGVLTVENNPGDIVLTPDGTRAVVSHFDLKRARDGLAKGRPLAELRAPLVVIDTASMTRVAAPAVCVAAHGAVIDRTGTRAYVACYGEDAIGEVRLDDPGFAFEVWPLGAALPRPTEISIGPYFVALDPTESLLIVTSTERGELRVVDRATRKTVAAVPVRGAAFGPAPDRDGKTWLLATQNPDEVVAIDSATWTVARSRSFSAGECVKPHQVARHGDRWFLVCEGDQKSASVVLEIDGSTLATVRTFAVGAYPDMIALPAAAP